MVALVSVDVDDERLGRLMQLYLHEWSGLVAWPIGADALYPHSLHQHRGSDTWASFLFIDPGAERPLGFALAMRDADGCWHVEDFFVIAGERRRGIGTHAAGALFAARPGRWTLTVRPENPRALGFWRSLSNVADEQVELGADGIARTRFSYVPSPAR
jgi:predicted acetyltransferase